MKIIITEEKSTKINNKLSKIKAFVEEICDMLEFDNEESDDDDEMEFTSRKAKRMPDDYEDDDAIGYKATHNRYKRMNRSRY